MTQENDEYWMTQALVLAKKAAEQGEVPVGALIVQNNIVIGRGYNQPIGQCDATGHAEVQAIRNAGQHTRNYRLADSTLYVTIEPCTMCLGAIVHARVSRIVFGALEPKAGVLASNPLFADADIFNHQFEWQGGVCEQEAAALIQNFFSYRRKAKKTLKKTE